MNMYCPPGLTPFINIIIHFIVILLFIRHQPKRLLEFRVTSLMVFHKIGVPVFDCRGTEVQYRGHKISLILR
jgi:hypothetical protein